MTCITTDTSIFIIGHPPFEFLQPFFPGDRSDEMTYFSNRPRLVTQTVILGHVNHAYEYCLRPDKKIALTASLKMRKLSAARAVQKKCKERLLF